MTTKKNNYLLAFYGDDFTGSTDALEFLSRAGAKTVLLLQPPSPETLKKYKDYHAIGIAGLTRSLEPEAMEKELRPAFTALNQLGVAHVHYKVCSTFDSSPQIGSIGKAIDVGMEVFQSSLVPLLVAAPALGRYCVFGNLFARMGIGSSGSIYRLDRHPSMSKHPVTPSDESDLRLHLSRQTSKKIGLLDILQIGSEGLAAKKALKTIQEGGSEVILIDALYTEQMTGIGRLLDGCTRTQHPLFSVGSSGIEMALGAYWTETGKLEPKRDWSQPGKADPLLVVSGSCSPVTEGQIAWALKKGFAEVVLDTEAMARSGEDTYQLEEYVSKITALIKEKRSVILHTCRASDENRVEKIKALFAAQGLTKGEAAQKTAQLYGTALGNIVRKVAEQTTLKRVVIAGGDTSSFAARAMGIEAVEMIAPVSPGAPLCRAFAPGSSLDGLEVNFKGGQVGAEDYFGKVLEGKKLSEQAYALSFEREKVY